MQKSFLMYETTIKVKTYMNQLHYPAMSDKYQVKGVCIFQSSVNKWGESDHC